MCTIFKNPIAYCLLFIAYCLLSPSAKAQEEKSRWLLGTGVTYCSYINNPGLNWNVTYRIVGNLHIGPDFSALLSSEREENGRVVKRKELEYNFNGQYLFALSKKVEIYPLAGINWSNVTNHPAGQEAVTELVTALNLGGGVEIEIKGVRFFFESKWVSQLNKYDLTTGILFRL
ncbi:MAG: outer membrane beta-barrel protein [Cyclobacteriaceae bacterium]